MPRWANPKYFHQAKPATAAVALALAENASAKTVDLTKLIEGSPNTRIHTINRIRQEAGVAAVSHGRNGKFGVTDEGMFREFCETLGVTPEPGEIHPEMRNICGVKGCWRLASKIGKPCYAHYYLAARHPETPSPSPDSPDSPASDSFALLALLRKVQKVMHREQIDRISLLASGEVEIDRTVKRRTKNKI